MFEPDIVCMQEVQWMGVIFYKFKLSVVRAVEFKSDTTSALSSDTVGLICKLIPLAVPNTPLLGATTRLLYTVNKEHTRVARQLSSSPNANLIRLPQAEVIVPLSSRPP